jgi:predicted Rdx family selenoprotein
LAAVISEEFGVQPKFVEGVRGVFDVVADGALVFSKDRVGRFPDSGEIIGALRKSNQ